MALLRGRCYYLHWINRRAQPLADVFEPKLKKFVVFTTGTYMQLEGNAQLVNVYLSLASKLINGRGLYCHKLQKVVQLI